MKIIDLDTTSVRELNQTLHDLGPESTELDWCLENPRGQHNLACGLDVELSITIKGHAGYFCAGMNQAANVTIEGNAGQGVAENMMSGEVRVCGDASQSAGATAHGGLLVIEGNAAARCGISMKGVDIVVGGSVGHMSCFMGQAGNLIICGDAGDALGDSLYEVNIFVKGEVQSLGADCVEKPITPELKTILAELLARAGMTHSADDFRYFATARTLYNFKVDNAAAY